MGPLPPADLAARKLPELILDAGRVLARIHRRVHDPIFFGRDGNQRFDDPDGLYGVFYAARHWHGAFAETCLREVGKTLLSQSFVDARSISDVRIGRRLRLAPLFGPGLARLGATSIVSSGAYAISQPWSAAIQAHPDAVDGIAYRSRHDDDQLCVALFDRCKAEVASAPGARHLGDELRRDGRMLRRYGVRIDAAS